MIAGDYAGYEGTHVTVLDNLTYAGNRGNLPERHPRLASRVRRGRIDRVMC